MQKIMPRLNCTNWMEVDIKTIKVGDKVLYIPSHLRQVYTNGQVGYVKFIDRDKDRVWVQFKGPNGELTPLKNLYYC